jgi:protein TonB
MAAPKLRVIEGGLAREAPRLPGVEENDRLVLPAPPIRDRQIAALFVGLLSLHLAILAAVMNLSLFGEPDGNAIDSVSVEVVDALPPAPAPSIEATGTAQPVDADAAAPPVDDTQPPVLVDDVADVATEDAPARPVVAGTALPVADEAAPAAAERATPSEMASPGVAERLVDDAVSTAAETEATSPANERTAAGPVPLTADIAETVVDEVAAGAATAETAETATPAASDGTAEAVAVEDVAVETAPPVAPAPAKPAKAAKPAPTKLAKPAAGKAASSAPAGGGRAAASAGGGAAKGLLSSYYGRLSAHLRAFRSYPAAAASRRLSGRAVVQVTINASGRVVRARVFRSSGHAVLDQAALASARRASPFPPIPKGIATSRFTFEAPVVFDLR